MSNDLPPIGGGLPPVAPGLTVGSGAPTSYVDPSRSPSYGLPGRPNKDPDIQAAKARRTEDEERLRRLLPLRSKDHRYQVFLSDSDGNVEKPKRGKAKPVLEVLGTQVLAEAETSGASDPAEVVQKMLEDKDPEDGFYVVHLVDPKGRMVSEFQPFVLAIGDVEEEEDDGEDEDLLEELAPPARRGPPPPPPPGFDPQTFVTGARQEAQAQQQEKEGLVSILGKVLEANLAPKTDSSMGLVIAMMQSQQESNRLAEERRERDERAREERDAARREREERDRRERDEAARKERDEATRREREHWQGLLATLTATLAPFLPKLVEILFAKKEGFDPATQVLIETLKSAGERKGTEAAMMDMMTSMMKASSEMQMQQMTSLIRQSSDVSGTLISTLMDRMVGMLKKVGEEEKPKERSIVSEVMEGVAAAAPLLMAAQQQAQQSAARPGVPQGMPRVRIPQRAPGASPQAAPGEPPVAEALPVPSAAAAAQQVQTGPYEPKSPALRTREGLGLLRALATGQVPAQNYWQALERLRDPREGLPPAILQAVLEGNRDAVISQAMSAVTTDAEMMGWIATPENAAFVEAALADLRAAAEGKVTPELAQAAVQRLQALTPPAAEPAPAAPAPIQMPVQTAEVVRQRPRRPRPGEATSQGAAQ